MHAADKIALEIVACMTAKLFRYFNLYLCIVKQSNLANGSSLVGIIYYGNKGCVQIMWESTDNWNVLVDVIITPEDYVI